MELYVIDSLHINTSDYKFRASCDLNNNLTAQGGAGANLVELRCPQYKGDSHCPGSSASTVFWPVTHVTGQGNGLRSRIVRETWGGPGITVKAKKKKEKCIQHSSSCVWCDGSLCILHTPSIATQWPHQAWKKTRLHCGTFEPGRSTHLNSPIRS